MRWFEVLRSDGEDFVSVPLCEAWLRSPTGGPGPSDVKVWCFGHYRDRPIPSSAPWSERRKGTHAAACGVHLLGVEGVRHRVLRFDGIVSPYGVMDVLDLHSLESFPDVCPPATDDVTIHEVPGPVCSVKVRVGECAHHPGAPSHVIQATSDRGTFDLGRVADRDLAVEIADICATAAMVEQPDAVAQAARPG